MSPQEAERLEKLERRLADVEKVVVRAESLFEQFMANGGRRILRTLGIRLEP